MKVLIIGGGSTGLTLANLLGEEHNITIVEKDEERAKDIATKTHALVVLGEGGDISILKQAGISEADAVVTTTDDKTNLMVCQIAKGENVSKIIPLINDPKDEELFIKLGVNHLISIVGTNITAIKRMLYQVGDARIIAQLGQGEVQIVEQTVSVGSKLIGKKAKIKGVAIAMIYRSGELLIPQDDAEFKEGDVLVAAVKTKDLSSLTELVSGK